MMDRILYKKFFIMYATTDEKYKQELIKHLNPLIDKFGIEIWDDGRIDAGVLWDETIKMNLAQAEVFLYLVSADSISSKYIKTEELKIAFEKLEEEQSLIIPIIIHPCDWKNTKIGALQALPHRGKPVSEWSNFHKAFESIVKGIRKRIISKPKDNGEIMGLNSNDKILNCLKLYHPDLYLIEKYLRMDKKRLNDLLIKLDKDNLNQSYTISYLIAKKHKLESLRLRITKKDDPYSTYLDSIRDPLQELSAEIEDFLKALKASKATSNLMYSKTVFFRNLLKNTTNKLDEILTLEDAQHKSRIKTNYLLPVLSELAILEIRLEKNAQKIIDTCSN